jgi:hypothetical protein
MATKQQVHLMLGLVLACRYILPRHEVQNMIHHLIATTVTTLGMMLVAITGDRVVNQQQHKSPIIEIICIKSSGQIHPCHVQK